MTYPYDATEALARLSGRLDAAIKCGCQLRLEQIQQELDAARKMLFTALHDGVPPSEDYR